MSGVKRLTETPANMQVALGTTSPDRVRRRDPRPRLPALHGAQQPQHLQVRPEPRPRTRTAPSPPGQPAETTARPAPVQGLLLLQHLLPGLHRLGRRPGCAWPSSSCASTGGVNRSARIISSVWSLAASIRPTLCQKSSPPKGPAPPIAATGSHTGTPLLPPTSRSDGWDPGSEPTRSVPGSANASRANLPNLFNPRLLRLRPPRFQSGLRIRTVSGHRRSHPGKYGLVLDEAGWARVQAVLSALVFAPDQLDLIVAGADKKRFAYDESGTRIRAIQGHSVPVSLGLAPAIPPEVLYHGTTVRFLGQIRTDGLLPMSRNQVHMVADSDLALRLGVTPRGSGRPDRRRVTDVQQRPDLLPRRERGVADRRRTPGLPAGRVPTAAASLTGSCLRSPVLWLVTERRSP